MKVEASKFRRVWFQLVNHDGNPFASTPPSRVMLSNDSIVDDAKKAVYKKCARLLQELSAIQLRVFAK